jgi:hypothetical protein
MKRVLKISTLLLAGLLIGWLSTGLFHSHATVVDEKPAIAPQDTTPSPGKNINRYGERIVRIV